MHAFIFDHQHSQQHKMWLKGGKTILGTTWEISMVWMSVNRWRYYRSLESGLDLGLRGFKYKHPGKKFD